MDAAARRKEILTLLRQSTTPVSASALAERFSVSRQIIVGDVALLRAAGEEISATPRGYVLPGQEEGIVRVLACVHTEDKMGRELELMVRFGCQVLDVIVEHPVYGQLAGQLQISTMEDVDRFIRSVEENGAKPLSDLTGGIHLHTLRCPNEQTYQALVAALVEERLLLGVNL